MYAYLNHLSGESNVSVWLLPAETSTEFEALQNIINILANKYHNHPFVPHVTLSMLPAQFPLDIVDRVLHEMKEDLFQETVEFEKLFTTDAGIAVYGKHDNHLHDLQRKFHMRLTEELKRSVNEGNYTSDQLEQIGVSLDVKNIVPWFPHYSVAYTPCDQQKGVDDLIEKGLYNVKDTVMELGGYPGFKVGAIWCAFCGGLKPEKWQTFKKIDAEPKESALTE